MPQWKMVGISEMLLGYKVSDDLAQAMDISQTLMLLGLGQGANYDAATILVPQRVLIGSEQLNVTARHAAVADPSAAPGTAVTGSGGTLGTGNWKFAYAWRVGSGTNKGGTTLISPLATQAVTLGDHVTVTIPALPTGIASADIYVSSAVGGSTMLLAGNTVTTTFDVAAAPSGAAAPAANTIRDTLTVVRAVNSSVAATHAVLVGSVKTIRDVQMPFTHQFAINPQTTEITFAGDGDQEYVSLHLGMRGTIQSDKWLTTIWEKILGVSPETINLPGDETTRWYPDAGNYPALRLRCIMHAIDDDTGLDVAVRLEVPKAQIYPRPWHPGAVGSAAKQMQDLAWTAQRTKKDLLDILLPGTLPSRGVFFNLAQLSTPLP